MITLRKLQELPEGARNRKLLLLLKEAEALWRKEPEPGEDQIRYWQNVTDLSCAVLQTPTPRELSVRTFWELRQRLLDFVGVSSADWDFQAPGDAGQPVQNFPFSVYLEDLRSPFNVGSILRTADAYGFREVLASPLTPGTTHPRVRRSSMEAEIGFRTLDLNALKAEWAGKPVFALELGGWSADQFRFPREPALVLLGSEELGLSPEILAWAESSRGRVTLPLYGHKASLNVGVAFGILASRWTASF